MSYFCKMATNNDATTDEAIDAFLKSVDFDAVTFLALFARPLNLNR